jgi:hypothetical protein
MSEMSCQKAAPVLMRLCSLDWLIVWCHPEKLRDSEVDLGARVRRLWSAYSCSKIVVTWVCKVHIYSWISWCREILGGEGKVLCSRSLIVSGMPHKCLCT